MLDYSEMSVDDLDALVRLHVPTKDWTCAWLCQVCLNEIASSFVSGYTKKEPCEKCGSTTWLYEVLKCKSNLPINQK